MTALRRALCWLFGHRNTTRAQKVYIVNGKMLFRRYCVRCGATSAGKRTLHPEF